MDNARVFISYTGDDLEIASALHDLLSDLGVETFFDKDIGHGRVWTAELREKLNQSTHLIVVATPNSKQSCWVWAEVGRVALKGGDRATRGCTIVPLLVDFEIRDLGPIWEDSAWNAVDSSEKTTTHTIDLLKGMGVSVPDQDIRLRLAKFREVCERSRASNRANWAPPCTRGALNFDCNAVDHLQDNLAARISELEQFTAKAQALAQSLEHFKNANHVDPFQGALGVHGLCKKHGLLWFGSARHSLTNASWDRFYDAINSGHGSDRKLQVMGIGLRGFFSGQFFKTEQHLALNPRGEGFVRAVQDGLEVEGLVMDLAKTPDPIKDANDARLNERNPGESLRGNYDETRHAVLRLQQLAGSSSKGRLSLRQTAAMLPRSVSHLQTVVERRANHHMIVTYYPVGGAVHDLGHTLVLQSDNEQDGLMTAYASEFRTLYKAARPVDL